MGGFSISTIRYNTNDQIHDINVYDDNVSDESPNHELQCQTEGQ